jgi:hypothetical protein
LYMAWDDPKHMKHKPSKVQWFKDMHIIAS